MTFKDIHELPVSSVRLLLLRDLIKFITENKDSQAYVDENIESNAVAKFFKDSKFLGMAFQVRNSSFSALLSSIPFSNRLFSMFSKSTLRSINFYFQIELL